MSTSHTKSHETHPTEVAPASAADQPASSETAIKLVSLLGLTEGQAQALLLAETATTDQLGFVEKVNLHAIAAALPAAAVQAIVSDPKLDLGHWSADFARHAAEVRTYAAAEDHLQVAIDNIHGSARIGADFAQSVISLVVPQIRSRLRANPAVGTTYSTVIAYQKNRFPGHHAAAAPAPAAATPPKA